MSEDSQKYRLPHGGLTMNKKRMITGAAVTLALCLFSASITALLVTRYDGKRVYRMMETVYQDIIENQPEAEQAVLQALKECRNERKTPGGESILRAYGYREADFLNPSRTAVAAFAAVGVLIGGVVFFLVLLFWQDRKMKRIRGLTEYLEQVNIGDARCFLQKEEDEFSKLQDELYKTVTELYQTREKALLAKNRFAENLYNIAHQMKTPLTAISLSVQTVGNRPQEEFAEQIRRQVLRLTCLEEALLLLSRIDAGTLLLERRETDVFTLLSLAADNLQELSQEADVFIDVPEAGAVTVCVDLEWTMEAVMNLMKNCMEHTKRGGTVFVSYEQNHLYTQVRIWDEGAGFAKEDLTHLFERFYRGQNEKGGGIGIGLAISKELIESQNGTVTAKNLPDGGACFEIRFYCH